MAKLLLGSVVGPQGPQGTPGVNGSQGPQGIPGPNEIAATTDVVGLTPGQLLYNNGGKVGSVEIVDDLETQASNKPLSAKMGALLGYFKRDVENQGYLFPQSKSFFEAAILSGKYKIENASDQPVPGVTASWVVDVTNNAAGGIVQIANCVKGDASVLGKTYRRIFILTGGGWQAWKEIPDKSYVDSAIGQIANDRGYKSSKRITTQLELDNTLNGKYYVEPIGELSAGWLDVTTRHELESQYQFQTFYQTNGKSIIRNRWGGTWNAWKEIATTESYTMQPSDMRNGWQIWAGIYNPIINKTGRLVTISGGAVMNSSAGANLQVIFNIPTQYRSTVSSASICSSQCAGNKNITLFVDHTNGDVKFDTSSGASLPAINEVVVIDFSYSV